MISRLILLLLPVAARIVAYLLTESAFAMDLVFLQIALYFACFSLICLILLSIRQLQSIFSRGAKLH